MSTIAWAMFVTTTILSAQILAVNLWGQSHLPVKGKK